jgi:hypothetical protein
MIKGSRTHDAFGRHRYEITWEHAIPYWFYLLAVLFFDYKSLRHDLLKDIYVVSTRILWLALFPWTILGIFPVFGKAPYSETSFSWTTFKNAIELCWMTFLSIPLAWLASVPVLCVFYTMFSRYQMENAVYTPPGRTTDEKWFFINGISNTPGMGFLNQKRFEQLFGRKVTLIYNPTQGIFLDLIECIAGRTFDIVAAPSAKAISEIRLALLDPQVSKVVLIGHSQGAIICQTVLQQISPTWFTDAVLNKLEVYTFASPASCMPDYGGKVHVEHFAHQYDAIAQIGVLHPLIKYPKTQPIFYNAERKGHILNEHYLIDFEKKPYKSKDGTESRLYSYLKGSKVKS